MSGEYWSHRDSANEASRENTSEIIHTDPPPGTASDRKQTPDAWTGAIVTPRKLLCGRPVNSRQHDSFNL